MTDLLSRPSARRDRTGLLPGRTSGTAGRASSGVSEGRPLLLSAALAACGAAGLTLLTCLGVAVLGWFLADAGAHGETTDALRAGADVWLVGHGSGMTVSGVPLGLVPLSLTVVLATVLYRAGRRAAAGAAPVEDDRPVLLAATVLTGCYVAIAVLVCVLAAHPAATPGLGRAALGAFLLAGVAGTLGLAAGTGRLRAWVERVPPWIRAIAFGATAATLLLVVASSVLVVVGLGLGFNEAATVLSRLDLGAGGYAMYALATVALAPNAVLLGAAYLLGPGFAIGTGTVVSPTVVALGPVPAFPLLAALPGDGATHPWLVGVMAVPVLVGAAGAVLAQRAYRVPAYDSAALRGFGSGFGAALLTTGAVFLAGGTMGTGRMADIGAHPGEVFAAAVAAMSLGGLVAGLVTAWWQRR